MACIVFLLLPHFTYTTLLGKSDKIPYLNFVLHTNPSPFLYCAGRGRPAYELMDLEPMPLHDSRMRPFCAKQCKLIAFCHKVCTAGRLDNTPSYAAAETAARTAKRGCHLTVQKRAK